MDRELIKAICRKRPEKKEIFELARMLDKECVPYYFNFERFSSKKFFENMALDDYLFLILIQCQDGKFLRVTFNHEGDGTMLEVINLTDDEILTDVSAERALEEIMAHFKK